MLQEKTNLIEIIGKLSEVDLEEKEKEGKEYITGKVTIKTTDTVDGVEKDIEIPLQVFSYKYTKAGKENPAYQSLYKVKYNMTSIAACGDPEQATCVRVIQPKGGLTEDIWFDRTRNVVATTVKPRASFFSTVPKDQAPTARFETIICYMGSENEVDKDGIETGRLKVVGAVPGWNGSINKIDYIVSNQKAIEHINTFWEKGQTVTVVGVIAYTSTIEDSIEEMGFGDPIVKHRTRSTKELIITKGSREGAEEEMAFNTKEVLEAMQARKMHIEKLKEEGTASASAAKAEPNMADYGF